ncbi:MAG: cellulase N-terminal Ig-like domain-containing protein [Planctomycetota bacterium]|jgi:hypothetical protein
MRTSILSIMMTLLVASISHSSESPPPAKRYKERINRTYDFNSYCKNPQNWIAEDKFASWSILQNKRKFDPKATAEPYNFYGENYKYIANKKFGHNSGSSLQVNFKVHEPYLKDPNKPYGKCLDDRWNKSYTIKELPVDMTKYNRLSAWVYIDGLQSVNMFIGIETDYDSMKEYYEQIQYQGRKTYSTVTRIAASQKKWTKVWIDFQHLDFEVRKRLKYIIIGHLWYGVQTSDNHEMIKFYWDDFKLENVANPRKYNGWGADPAVVTVNQLGYKPLSEKVALIPATEAQSIFYVRDTKTDKVVYRGGFKMKNSLMGEFLEGDFTALDTPGTYYVQAGDKRSVNFPVTERPYHKAAIATLDILAGMRCGTATKLHEACHLDSCWDAKKNKHVDLVGGYHDAGDMKRFEHNMICQPKFHMGLYPRLAKKDPLRKMLLDETMWAFTTTEKHWNQFGMLVTPHIKYKRRVNNFTDNKIGTKDDYPFDGSPRNMLNWAGPAFIRLASQYKEKDPELHNRIMKIARGITDKFGKRVLWMNMEMYKATGEEKYKERAKSNLDYLLSCQDNRIIPDRRSFISGMIATKPDFSEFIYYPSERNYGDFLAEAVEAMKMFPEEYYRIYFFLRRYADFYVKRAHPKAGPWGIPPTMTYGRKIWNSTFDGPGNHIGIVDGEPYYLHYYGKHTEMAMKLPFGMMFVADALADPNIESQALRMTGQMTGWNPFNFSHIRGFGEESLTHVFAWYPFTKGMIGRYLDLNRHLRTDAHEIWTVTQTFANTALSSVDAPCRIEGLITAAGKPYSGSIEIKTPSGRVVNKQNIKGGTLPETVISGGGYYTISAAGSDYKFAAIAGAQYEINFDIENEIKLSGKKISGKISKIVKSRGNRIIQEQLGIKGPTMMENFPVSFPFDGRSIDLLAGVPYTIELQAEAVGKGTSKHKIALFAANAEVTPAETTIEVSPGKQTDLTFTITPTKGGETICLLTLPLLLLQLKAARQSVCSQKLTATISRNGKWEQPAAQIQLTCREFSK